MINYDTNLIDKIEHFKIEHEVEQNLHVLYLTITPIIEHKIETIQNEIYDHFSLFSAQSLNILVLHALEHML